MTPEGDRLARPRVAFLTYSSGEFDARAFRMAESAMDAGYEVVIYARWHPWTSPVEERDGYRIVRAPYNWKMGVPGLRAGARRRAEARMARSITAEPTSAPRTQTHGPRSGRAARRPGGSPIRRVLGVAKRIARRAMRPFLGLLTRSHWWDIVREWPLRPLGWAYGLETHVEPADIWHGMWAGSLPALDRMRRRHGGRAVYDSRDIFMRSRQFARLGQPGHTLLSWLERRLARRMDDVLTVNDGYAEILERHLGVARPSVVLNCPARWSPPSPPPDLIRSALGLPAATRVVLYQGIFTFERGIEQAMDAILTLPDSVLVLLGFGPGRDGVVARAAQAPYAGRVLVLPAVPPADLLRWTASADVSVMAIQPTTLNHRHTTPQKLFESLAAGVPVVASDLPGMAPIVRSTGAGVLCDPTSPTSIATAIRSVLDAPDAERAAMRRRARDAATDRYNWEAQVAVLLERYRRLVGPEAVGGDHRVGSDDAVGRDDRAGR